MNRIYIKTYGCQMNERDSEAVAAQLRARGYSIVEREEEADTILLNTCAVRDQAEQKAIGKAGYLLARKRKEGNLRVGILGCMAQNRGEELLASLPDLDLLVGTQKFHRVPEMIDAIIEREKGLGPRPRTLVDLEEESGSQNTIREHFPQGKNGQDFQPTAFVSIMQGCNMRCSFCIVPKTRGAERSRPIEDIVAECRELADQGTREITLLGQIVTSYGRREIPFVDGKSPFVQLIEAVAEVPGIERIRFTSPHPRGFKEDLVEAFRRIPELMPACHLPVQSGSDRILRLMNRPYTARRYKEIVQSLRETHPEMCLSTDIIVGFPGETEEDFAQTVTLFDEARFEMAFIFKYSPRGGTVSSAMADDVPAEVKEERNRILLDRLAVHSIACHQNMVGTVAPVLVEGPARRGEGIFMGRTPNHRKIIFAAQPRLIGSIVPVRLLEAYPSHLRGELEIQMH
jgi:tRNA-2-methylthio-N6-dimethylallyladenosine synthase